MKKNFKGQEEFAVLGELDAQFSFVQIVKSMLSDLFGKDVDNVKLNDGVFFIYDTDGRDLQMVINNMKLVLSPQEQGAIAVLRYALKRGIDKVSAPIMENANKIFGKKFYNQYFIKTDWEWAPIHIEIGKLIVPTNVTAG